MKTISHPVGLARHFHEHNRRVIWLALAALLAAAVAWGVFFLGVHWGKLILLTLQGEWDRTLEWMPWPFYPAVLGVMLVAQFFYNKATAQLEGGRWWLTLAGLLLLPVRFTSAVFANLSARAHPRAQDLHDCWSLLEELLIKQKIPHHALTALLPPGANSARLLYLLAITELTTTDEYGGVFYLHFRSDGSRRTVRRWKRELLA